MSHKSDDIVIHIHRKSDINNEGVESTRHIENAKGQHANVIYLKIGRQPIGCQTDKTNF